MGLAQDGKKAGGRGVTLAVSFLAGADGQDRDGSQADGQGSQERDDPAGQPHHLAVQAQMLADQHVLRHATDRGRYRGDEIIRDPGRVTARRNVAQINPERLTAERAAQRGRYGRPSGPVAPAPVPGQASTGPDDDQPVRRPVVQPPLHLAVHPVGPGRLRRGEQDEPA